MSSDVGLGLSCVVTSPISIYQVAIIRSSDKPNLLISEGL